MHRPGRSIDRCALGIRSVLGRALTAVSVVVSGVVIAAPPAFAQTSPYTTVEVVFGSGVIQNTLPFDVPFLMTGAIDRAVQSVTIRYVRLSGSEARAAERAPQRCDSVVEKQWSLAGRWGRVVDDTAN